MEMTVSFAGGKKVNAAYKGFTVRTDQPKEDGGDNSAPEPYDLFLASVGTCAGVYIAYFCEERGLDTRDIHLTLRFNRNEEKRLIDRIRIHIDLPSDFPSKYRNAIVKTAGLCTVKRTLMDPPEISITAAIGE